MLFESELVVGGHIINSVWEQISGLKGGGCYAVRRRIATCNKRNAAPIQGGCISVKPSVAHAAEYGLSSPLLRVYSVSVSVSLSVSYTCYFETLCRWRFSVLFLILEMCLDSAGLNHFSIFRKNPHTFGTLSPLFDKDQ